MVISLATSDCHSVADALTSSTVPVVIDARNVMIATTATSARPEIEARGTIGDRLRARAGSCGRSCPRSTNGPCSSPALLIDPTHRYATAPDAAPAAARHTDPSA